MPGPTFFKGGELQTTSLFFVGSLMGDSQADVEGRVPERLQDVSAKFLARFRLKFPDRALDALCLAANDRVGRAGIDSVQFIEFPIMGAIKFFACNLSLSSIVKVASRTQMMRVMLAQQTFTDESAALPDEIKAELRDNFPQPHTIDAQKDVLYLAAYLMNMPSRVNMYLYSVPDDAVFCAQRGFCPAAGVDSIEKVAALLRWVDAGEAGSESCQRDRCFCCRASALNDDVNLVTCSACKVVCYW